VHATDLLLAGLAAAAAGLVNALAGGGTLVTFPVLVGLGLPAVVANVTSTVALTPGYLAAAFAQSRTLGDQQPRLRLLLPAGALGGLTGGALLLGSGERLFRSVVPALLIVATLLLAAQEPLRRFVAGRADGDGRPPGRDGVNERSASGSGTVTPPAGAVAALLVGLAAIYGGYFGAGVSIVVLAALALTLDDSLVRLNALKQVIALAINGAASVLFLFSGRIVWPAAVVMAASSVLGGALGGRLAETIPPAVLRWTVVACGALAAVAFAVRGEGAR
jgi:uncharacterized membrane protein YfcA